MLTRSVFIIGMPGSGKSSLGRKVAANLKLPYVDMDRRIADVFGCTVTEIFARWGEDAFRAAEHNLLVRICLDKPMLVSTGGGTVMRPENRELMRNFGLILLVDRPLEQILGDIKLDRRPTLEDKAQVERVYYERVEAYHAAADLVLDNSHGFYPGVAGMERLLRSTFAL